MRTIRVIIKGDRACFTRPEMKAERVSYDVPTPGALEGILKSIYWKPAMRYVIDKIVVLNPIRFETLTRNEVKSKIQMSKIKKQMQEAKDVASGKMDAVTADACIYTDKDRTQRSSMILRDVCYGVEFHVELTGLKNSRELQECDTQIKHEDKFIKRCQKGQYFRQPCLGCSEFPADVTLTDHFSQEMIDSSNMGTHDLGFMLYKVEFRDHGHPINDDWDKNIYSDEADSVFYRPSIVDGVIDVEKYRGQIKC